MKLKIAICDDEQRQTEYVTASVLSWAKGEGHLCEISSFPSAEAFLFAYDESRNFDILLLDIEMGGINGVELAKKIRAQDTRTQIIFITGYPDFVLEGYEVSALHYLLKPVAAEKIAEVLTRAAGILVEAPRLVLLPMGKESVRLPADDILYAESDGHYILVHTARETVRLRMTIPELAELLGEGFYRCGRSFLVGLRHVSRITRPSIKLANGTEVPLGKGLYDDMNQSLIRYLRKL